MNIRPVVIVALILALASPLVAGDRIKVPEFVLSVSLVGFSVADTAITIYGTSRLGMVERNSFMRPFLEGHHYAALWAIQGAACAGIIWACHGLISHDDKTVRIIGYAALVAVNLGRAYCVYSNLRTHARAR
jgi:hypothetical protein